MTTPYGQVNGPAKGNATGKTTSKEYPAHPPMGPAAAILIPCVSAARS
jgi:hypothetical protein